MSAVRPPSSVPDVDKHNGSVVARLHELSKMIKLRDGTPSKLESLPIDIDVSHLANVIFFGQM